MKKENRDFDEHELDALIQEAMADDLFVAVPDGFADKMEKKAQQINLIRFWQEAAFKHASILGGAVAMLSIVLGVLYYFSAESISGILGFLIQFKWILMVGFALLFGIQMADTWMFNKLGENEKTRKYI